MNCFRILTVCAALAAPLATAAAQESGTPSADTRTEAGAEAGAAADSAARMLIELNKAEQTDLGCQYFLLLRNETDYDFEVLRLDLYFFDTGGVISKRLLVDTPPLDSDATKVATFVARDLACDGVSQILLNKVEPCDVAEGDAPACDELIALNNRTEVTFFK